jgi:predicted N-formylglutamate amidohydrolase
MDMESTKMRNVFLLFTCEHSKCGIPGKYQGHFEKKRALLKTHRGYDWGTFLLGRSLSRAFGAPVVMGKFSRLLIDLNRSESNRNAFSEITKLLSKEEQEEIKMRYHRPHWNEVQKIIEAEIGKGKTVIHIGVHSFTPKLYGEVRNTDLGLLYDSRIKKEKEMGIAWQKSLQSHSDFRIRRNYPYDGKGDGLTSEIRKKYSSKDYRGFEIEVNQSLVTKASDLKKIEKLLIVSLRELLLNHFSA